MVGNQPKKVDGQIAARTEFYKTILFRVVKGIFDVTLPIDWELDYILNNFIHSGYIIITESPAGVLPLRGTFQGFNYFDYPTHCVISVPILESFTRTIGVDCQIIYLERMRTRTFFAFNQMVDIYAYKLAAADAGIDVNLFNSRVAYIAEAETKAQSETLKSLYNQIAEGEPFVVYRSNALSPNGKGLNVAFGNVKQNYVADLIQDSKRTIMNEFLTLLGINNANTDKRERLITDEVNANNIELMCNTNLWEENLRICMERVHNLFPSINFDIKLKFDGKYIAKMFDSRTEQEGEVNDTA